MERSIFLNIMLILCFVSLSAGCDILQDLDLYNEVEIELSVITWEDGEPGELVPPALEQIHLNIDGFNLQQVSGAVFYFPIKDSIVIAGHEQFSRLLTQGYISKGRFRIFESNFQLRHAETDSNNVSPSLVISGNYQGDTFELRFDDPFSATFYLRPPLLVDGEDGEKTKFILSLDSRMWFIDNDGVALNPLKEEAKSVILDNIRRSMSFQYEIEDDGCNVVSEQGCNGRSGRGESIFVSITDAEASEMDEFIHFPVTLSESLSDTVLVSFITQSNSAKAGKDFVDTSGTKAFLPGTTEILISVKLMDDEVSEPDNHFTLVLTNTEGADLYRAHHRAIGVIIDDDD